MMKQCNVGALKALDNLHFCDILYESDAGVAQW